MVWVRDPISILFPILPPLNEKEKFIYSTDLHATFAFHHISTYIWVYF